MKAIRLSRLQIVLCLAFCPALLTAAALGCGWPGTDHSVRFNAYRTEKEFSRLPPLPGNDENDGLFSWDEEVEYYLYDGDAETPEEMLTRLWREAMEATDAGDLASARHRLRDYLKQTERLRTEKDDLQKRRNAATDMLDALTALDQGSSASAVSEYLKARRAYDEKPPLEKVRQLLACPTSDRNLADNWDYLRAAVLYREGPGDAATAFLKLAARYPHSEKREAALFMYAVARMKVSGSYAQAQEKRGDSLPCSECRDDAWREARAGFERVIREYPRGRYPADARGWLAYLSLGVGDRVSALVEYYRLLAEPDRATRILACRSLALTRSHLTDEEMRQVEAQLEAFPEAALAYAYHTIYNSTFLPAYYRFEKEQSDDYDEEGKRELRHIAAFATRMMARYPAAVGGGFVLRLAQANLELGNNDAAAAQAKLALGMRLKGEARGQALFVQGVAEHRRRDYRAAQQALLTAAAENPDNRLTEPARRYLAMVAEDMGDLHLALEQYLALDYRIDVGYFVDVLMTPEQLAQFIETHPDIKQRNELIYALGVRYLRERRWDAARQTLSRVRTTGRDVDEGIRYQYYDGYYAWRGEPVKGRPFDGRVRGPRPYWVEQDIATANKLEQLERQVEAAQGEEAKAEALYQLAGYQYHSHLLFYNPLAWRGDRHQYISEIDRQGNYRQLNESQLVRRHVEAHDMAANSLAIFLEVVRRYPNTRAARDALYTAAVCHERLDQYNNYWRGVYENGGHAGERMVTYQDVRRAYPDYRFPSGTTGWEPMTRTVNGKSAWPAPPKPKPRPSRLTRGLRFATAMLAERVKAWDKVVKDLTEWAGRVGGWLYVGFMISSLLFLWRRAADSRQLLRDAYRRHALPPGSTDEGTGQSEAVRAPARPCDAALTQTESGRTSDCDAPTTLRCLHLHVNDDWCGKLLADGRNLFNHLRRMAGDKRGRAGLAQNAATHGLFIALLARLL